MASLLPQQAIDLSGSITQQKSQARPSLSLATDQLKTQAEALGTTSYEAQPRSSSDSHIDQVSPTLSFLPTQADQNIDDVDMDDTESIDVSAQAWFSPVLSSALVESPRELNWSLSRSNSTCSHFSKTSNMLPSRRPSNPIEHLQCLTPASSIASDAHERPRKVSFGCARVLDPELGPLFLPLTPLKKDEQMC